MLTYRIIPLHAPTAVIIEEIDFGSSITPGYVNPGINYILRTQYIFFLFSTVPASFLVAKHRNKKVIFLA